MANPNIPQWPGKIIKQLRADAKISQMELSLRAGIPQGTVHQFEHGDCAALRPFEKMLDVLGYELEVVKK